MSLAKRFFAILMAAAMLFASGCASTSTRESTGEYIDDTTITTKVKMAILDEPTLKVLQINVETYKSMVQLSGFVNTSTQIAKAGSIARSIRGVASVQNDLRLR
jgi:osmotically-inducible protein OsmY